jgi:replicative DNA helicase
MIENTILTHLLHNEDYGRKVLPFLKDEYFHEPSDKTIFALIKKHVDKYNNFPSREALFIDLSNIKNINENLYSKTKEKLENFSFDEETSIDWLLDKTEQFCQDKAVYNGLMQAIKIIDNKADEVSKGSIPKILQDALAVSFDTNIGHDFLEDWEQRYEVYHKVENKIPFDLEYFNTVTKGGFSKKTFNVFLGGTNVGKSLVMCHMSAYNLLIGKNVLYITLEMSEDRIAERVDANLLDTPLDDLQLLPHDSYEKLITELRNKTSGKLIIKEYPTASAGANHFRFLLNELRLKKSFIPDIIYIDYINLCISSRLKSGIVGSYGYIKAISEELRGLAVEYNVPVVTATQINRAGFLDSDVDLTHTSESFGLPQTADFMAAIISTEELEGLNQYMIKQLKNRYNRKGSNRRFIIGVDMTKMRLYDVEESAQNISPDVNDDVELETSPVKSTFDMSKFADFT